MSGQFCTLLAFSTIWSSLIVPKCLRQKSFSQSDAPHWGEIFRSKVSAKPGWKSNEGLGGWARKVYEGQHPPLVVPPPCLALVTPFLNLKSSPTPTSNLAPFLVDVGDSSVPSSWSAVRCNLSSWEIFARRAVVTPLLLLPTLVTVGTPRWHCTGDQCTGLDRVSSGHTTNQRFGHPSAYPGTAWVILGSGQYSSNATSSFFRLVCHFCFNIL